MALDNWAGVPDNFKNHDSHFKSLSKIDKILISTSPSRDVYRVRYRCFSCGTEDVFDTEVLIK